MTFLERARNIKEAVCRKVSNPIVPVLALDTSVSKRSILQRRIPYAHVFSSLISLAHALRIYADRYVLAPCE